MKNEKIDGAESSVPLECISSKKTGSRIINLVAETILSERRFNPLHYVPVERRRDGWGAISKTAFPAVFSDGSLTKPPGLLRAEKLGIQGFGIVVVYRHFSSNDPLVLTGFCHNQSEMLDEKEVFTPLAYHEYTRAAKRLLEYFGVTPLPIVTRETVKKHENYDAAGNTLRLGTGTDQYKVAAKSLLERGGVLFVAPSATRTPTHEPWKHAIGMLVEATGDNVAFMSVGLDIQDPTITNYERYRGFNIRKTYLVSIGDTLTKAELIQRAEERGVTVDQCMSDDMAMLVRPQTLGESYRELRERRLYVEAAEKICFPKS